MVCERALAHAMHRRAKENMCACVNLTVYLYASVCSCARSRFRAHTAPLCSLSGRGTAADWWGSVCLNEPPEQIHLEKDLLSRFNVAGSPVSDDSVISDLTVCMFVHVSLFNCDFYSDVPFVNIFFVFCVLVTVSESESDSESEKNKTEEKKKRNTI